MNCQPHHSTIHSLLVALLLTAFLSAPEALAQRGGPTSRTANVQPVAVAPVQYADLMGIPQAAPDTGKSHRAQPRPMSEFSPGGSAPMGSQAARSARQPSPRQPSARQRPASPATASPTATGPAATGPAATGPRQRRMPTAQPAPARDQNPSTARRNGPPEYFPGAVPEHAPDGSYPQRELEDAARHYAKDAEASSVTTGSVMYVPYEKQVPTIKGSPMHFTLIELAPREYVVDTFLGDPMRWNVEIGSSGSQQRFTQIVSVNPLQCGPASSDLALTTNMGRVYRVHLQAVECDIPSEAERAYAARPLLVPGRYGAGAPDAAFPPRAASLRAAVWARRRGQVAPIGSRSAQWRFIQWPAGDRHGAGRFVAGEQPLQLFCAAAKRVLAGPAEYEYRLRGGHRSPLSL